MSGGWAVDECCAIFTMLISLHGSRDGTVGRVAHLLTMCHGPGGGGSRVGFGWVCATQAFKCGPSFGKVLQSK